MEYGNRSRGGTEWAGTDVRPNGGVREAAAQLVRVWVAEPHQRVFWGAEPTLLAWTREVVGKHQTCILYQL